VPPNKRMRALKFSLLALGFVAPVALGAGKLCFSPVKERAGDVSSKRSLWQRFDYRIQMTGQSLFLQRSAAHPTNSRVKNH